DEHILVAIIVEIRPDRNVSTVCRADSKRIVNALEKSIAVDNEHILKAEPSYINVQPSVPIEIDYSRRPAASDVFRYWTQFFDRQLLESREGGCFSNIRERRESLRP